MFINIVDSIYSGIVLYGNLLRYFRIKSGFLPQYWNYRFMIQWITAKKGREGRRRRKKRRRRRKRMRRKYLRLYIRVLSPQTKPCDNRETSIAFCLVIKQTFLLSCSHSFKLLQTKNQTIKIKPTSLHVFCGRTLPFFIWDLLRQISDVCG